MRRVVSVAFLSASLAILPSAFSQRTGHSAGFSGGHSGGFSHGPIGGGTVGHFGGGFAGGSFSRSPGFAPRTFATAPNFVSTAPNHAFVPGYRVPVAASPAWRDDGRGDHGRDRDFHYRPPYRGYGYGGYPYAVANSWELLPWDIGYPDYSGYDDSGFDAQPPSSASVAAPDDGYRPDYEGTAEQAYAYPPPPDEPVTTAVTPEPELTLIFSDGHHESIHNYVLTSDSVIVLDQAASGRQQRIPLASLDLPATEQAAQQAGLDFTPPA